MAEVAPPGEIAGRYLKICTANTGGVRSCVIKRIKYKGKMDVFTTSINPSNDVQRGYWIHWSYLLEGTLN